MKLSNLLRRQRVTHSILTHGDGSETVAILDDQSVYPAFLYIGPTTQPGAWDDLPYEWELTRAGDVDDDDDDEVVCADCDQVMLGDPLLERYATVRTIDSSRRRGSGARPTNLPDVYRDDTFSSDPVRRMGA